MNVDEAFTMMRNHARSNNRRLIEVAYTVISDPAGIRDLANS